MPVSLEHTYQLFSKLFSHGLKEEDLKVVAQVDALAVLLPDPFDEDEVAADHQHIFGFNLFPYESVFLDPSGQMGGDVTASAILDYRQAGFDPDPAAVSPDHIGQELAFLSFLCRAEAKATAERDAPQTALIQQQQRAFLDRHTLFWLPPLVKAVRDQRHPFYDALAVEMLETISAHRELLGGAPGVNFSLPDPPALLENEKTGLKDIAAFLLTPAFSGIYLGRDTISRLAKDHSMPHGFGQRRQMLASLLRSAANYGDLDPVLSSLQELVANWENAYQEMAGPSTPIASAAIWGRRASATAGMITRMRSRIADFAQETPDLLDTK